MPISSLSPTQDTLKTMAKRLRKQWPTDHPGTPTPSLMQLQESLARSMGFKNLHAAKAHWDKQAPADAGKFAFDESHIARAMAKRVDPHWEAATKAIRGGEEAFKAWMVDNANVVVNLMRAAHHDTGRNLVVEALAVGNLAIAQTIIDIGGQINAGDLHAVLGVERLSVAGKRNKPAAFDEAAIGWILDKIPAKEVSQFLGQMGKYGREPLSIKPEYLRPLLEKSQGEGASLLLAGALSTGHEKLVLEWIDEAIKHPEWIANWQTLHDDTGGIIGALARQGHIDRLRALHAANPQALSIYSEAVAKAGAITGNAQMLSFGQEIAGTPPSLDELAMLAGQARHIELLDELIAQGANLGSVRGAKFHALFEDMERFSVEQTQAVAQRYLKVCDINMISFSGRTLADALLCLSNEKEPAQFRPLLAWLVEQGLDLGMRKVADEDRRSGETEHHPLSSWIGLHTPRAWALKAFMDAGMEVLSPLTPRNNFGNNPQGPITLVGWLVDTISASQPHALNPNVDQAYQRHAGYVDKMTGLLDDLLGQKRLVGQLLNPKDDALRPIRKARTVAMLEKLIQAGSTLTIADVASWLRSGADSAHRYPHQQQPDTRKERIVFACRNGVDVNATLPNGNTLLHVVSGWNDDLPLIETLIGLGADTKAVNAKKKTPRDTCPEHFRSAYDSLVAISQLRPERRRAGMGK